MTVQEAIGKIENMLIVAEHDCDELNKDYDIEQVETLKKALVALNKQLPMKPIKNKSYVRFCQKCNAVITKSFKYCDECGQRIDRGDEN